MEIVNTYPPNIEEIKKFFPYVRDRSGILFTYGKFLHNPSNVIIPEHILAHEEVHAERQYVVSPEYWWERYLKDADFMYEEELLAHQREYQVWCALAKSRNERRLGLKTIARRLSSDLYGNVVTFSTAREDIKNV